MPTTLYPSDFNNAAVTEESTPPDMATTTLVSCGRPLRSRLLSMVPVIAAIAAASRASRSGNLRRKAVGLIGTAEKLLFNIGRILVRQSRSAHSQRGKRQILPPGRKGGAAAALEFSRYADKVLKYLNFSWNSG